MIMTSKNSNNENSENDELDDSNTDKELMTILADKYDKEYNKKIIGTMLKILDGYKYLAGCIVIMTTNDIESIDNAVLRPGRIDHIIELTYADKYQIQQIQQIFKYYYNGYKLDDAIIQKMVVDKLTTSYIINTLVMPNLGYPTTAIEKYI